MGNNLCPISVNSIMSHQPIGGGFAHLVGHYSTLIALIGFGSIVHAVVQYNESRLLGKPFRRLDFLIAIILAGFSGLMFSMSAAYLTESELAVYWVGGMGAFLGLKGLNRLTDVMIELLTHKARK